MRADRVALRVDEGVAHLRLSRPDAGNAIDRAMVEALDEAVGLVEKAVTEHTARAVLLAAEGSAFCVGGDLRYFRERLDDLPGELDAMIGVYHGSTLPRLAALDVPVVVAAQGGVGGGGLGLLWIADILIAADDLKLATGFTRLGMTGDGGSSWYLPRLVGLRRAQALALRSTAVSAREALDLGLVTDVVRRGDLAEVAAAQAAELATGPTWAYAGIKRLLADSGRRTYPEQLTDEYRVMLAGAGRADVREGITAFAERRAPRFDGR
ncbi:enoyl-CoA hydratase/isomerase family protein [Pseudonocardia sp. WMMC193]|uniref:enoyl-CoA hydratase/isomerase family protein n=1 Tax=Pseudonocardia sp. WMMC193 TaxID=2911965 RepID=UPI001F3B5B54|nr:enoyl-CoA hydratase/isomerase family protein [Pseudonocardia sp. WMMC193]MCF7548587.1 enoyl-CoA hydratase/isomerase family protein [Pseudonocardia sp. WMMC193]